MRREGAFHAPYSSSPRRFGAPFRLALGLALEAEDAAEQRRRHEPQHDPRELLHARQVGEVGLHAGPDLLEELTHRYVSSITHQPDAPARVAVNPRWRVGLVGG